VALSGCTGSAPAAAPNYPKIILASPTPFVAASSSLCAHPDSSAPDDWLSVVCAVADRLVAAKSGMRALDLATLNGRTDEAVSQAGLSTTELLDVNLVLSRAPSWPAGASIVADLTAAISTYRNAVDHLRYAARTNDSSQELDGKRALDAGDKIMVRVAKALAAKATTNPIITRYVEFLDHSKTGLQQALGWFDKLRVANNLVNDQDALNIAQQMAAWGVAERNWLEGHPTAPCYLPVKEHWLSWVVDPAYNLGEAYTRWAKFWPADNAALWSQVMTTVADFNTGYDKYAAELQNPTQTCVGPKVAPKASPTP